MNSPNQQQVIFSHSDLYEVLAWTFPNTAKKIKDSIMYRVKMVFWQEASISSLNAIESKDRLVRYEEIHYFVWEVFWESEQQALELEYVIMSDLRSEAEKIYETAKQICEITWKSFSQSINFLLENKNVIPNEPKDEQGAMPLPAPSPADANPKTWISDEDKAFIRTYVSAGKDEDEKKSRRIEMAKRFDITVRQAGIISSWSNRRNFTKEEKNSHEPAYTAWEMFIDYLDEFFEWEVQTPQECSISYMDMHDCFCRDTWLEIDCAEVTRIWNSLLSKKWATDKDRRSERGYSTPLVKSRQKLASGKFILDKSCNVLLSHEVEDLFKK
ncbi:MAG: hypothetical protein ACD_2C00132G0001 [uncultured bacterium (gcode 4)]|uniref:Uncharacterized protein n=1 Tax=uncultured bacterium (gcode 4) TaxID=1234023 RepID=K2GGT5_9BACT|nr:MAG: hypothetical protein ACD_2C00132G0001 [uncultured bacterium (gcode 4)]